MEEEKRFRDCADLYQAGFRKNAVYTIHINPQETKKVRSCEEEVSAGPQLWCLNLFSSPSESSLRFSLLGQLEVNVMSVNDKNELPQKHWEAWNTFGVNRPCQETTGTGVERCTEQLGKVKTATECLNFAEYTSKQRFKFAQFQKKF